MITIYHNNKCSKSRCALELLKNSGKPYTIINYLDDVPTRDELKNLLKLLKLKPIELIRTNEALWKENYKHLNLSDAKLITLMTKNPKLIERPIVINGNQAVIGRPTEKVLDIL